MARAARPPGFTLIELMVVLLVLGLAMSLTFGFGETLLPKGRLDGAARDVARALDRVRLHATVRQEELVFAYDLDQDAWEAWFPQERDEDGRVLGPGRTSVLEPARVHETMALERIVLADGTVREDGLVEFTVSPLGRIPPHDVVVVNPEFPEVEVLTVRVVGMRNTASILEGRPPPEVLDEAELR